VPYELDVAGHAGDKLNMLGDFLQFGGQLAVGKGLQGDWSGSTPTVAPIGGTSGGFAGPWGASLGEIPTPTPRPLKEPPVLRRLYGGPR